MKLPIAIEIDGEFITGAKTGEASAGVLAAARKEAESGDEYSGILEWCAGVIKEFPGHDASPSEIKRILRAAPFETAHAIACFGMAETKGDDSIQGEYRCPKCGQIVKCDKREIDGEIDDRSDHLFSLEYETLDDPSKGITISLDKPVEIKRKDTGDVVESVDSFIMGWPTLGQCIKAHQRHPDDADAMQRAVYAEALQRVNGRPVDANWKTSFGDFLFKKMSVRDNAKINAEMKRYSINMTKERVCMKCKNHFEAEIDLRSFFASGLTSA